MHEERIDREESTGTETLQFKIKKNANVRKNATALSGCLREGKIVELQAIGAGAVNQAVKIMVQARAEISRLGKDLLVKPGMRNIIVNDDEVTITTFNFVMR